MKSLGYVTQCSIRVEAATDAVDMRNNYGAKGVHYGIVSSDIIWHINA
jgi:hypothetical protein